MTALRPERDSSSYGGEAAYGGADAFEGADTRAFGGAGGFETTVAGFADPLTDPLPGQAQGQAQAHGQAQARGHARPQGQAQAHGYGPDGLALQWSSGQPPAPQHARSAPSAPRPPSSYEEAVAALPLDDETVALRLADLPGTGEGSAAGTAGTPAPGGRAARRKAARRRGRHGGAQEPQEPQESAQGAAEAPRSRMEARRAARARKPNAGVLVSRMIGEVFITTGVLMLLFVTYQLWWSNVRAHQQAGSAAHHLQQDWADGKRNPGTFSPGQGFAILHIPKLDVVAPIAEGISKTQVLDRGMVGHYGEGDLKTAMPDAKTGNFALAGHRNTHGEPFRYINRLQPGDEIVVETQDDYYVYKMSSILPVTSPSNTSVLDPVPKGSGFTAPGRYITLTTCTPEFTSKYRMIVWGKMVEDRPRSKGKPDALVG
ncbi:class E sortase [Streptomyces sp. NPDC005381]|uniref:class E sortase n=1 Tax=Streptomyces sp. NPDC005381 TaxID=3364714 RepID=UPI0036B99A21